MQLPDKDQDYTRSGYELIEVEIRIPIGNSNNFENWLPFHCIFYYKV